MRVGEGEQLTQTDNNYLDANYSAAITALSLRKLDRPSLDIDGSLCVSLRMQPYQLGELHGPCSITTCIISHFAMHKDFSLKF